MLVGALVTAAVSWASWTLDRRNEHDLLRGQARQAAGLASAAFLSLRDPMAFTLQIEEATEGDVGEFRRAIGPVTGRGRLFEATALFRVDPATPDAGGRAGVERLAAVGDPPVAGPDDPEVLRLVRRAVSAPTLVVSGARSGGEGRLLLAIGNPGGRLVVYTERSIPADRTTPVSDNPAFADLDFAMYLGPPQGSGVLTYTNVPPSRLPLTGERVSEAVPFGDNTLTLVVAARGRLGGSLGFRLPWILGAGGGVLTVISALAGVRFDHRRREAERDARTIAELYGTLDGLYGQQRSIAEALQRALLPHANPHVPGLEIASRYVAGARGVDIGGDWYSTVPIDETRYAFLVGDVSGRGVSAATVMARLRFTMRAYLIEGHAPDVVLEMCSRQFDLTDDGHFATVLVGVGDLTTGEVRLANAGHLEPLLITASGAEFVTTEVGVPIGVERGDYPTTRVVLPPGSVLLAFTDGLVERRDESLDVALDRLVSVASASPPGELEDFVDGVVHELTHHESEDDIAVLALRRL